MCGIVGFVNYKKNINNYRNVLNNMTQKLSLRGPDEQGFYINKNVALAHKRLIVLDHEGGKQPMIENYSYNEYIIVCNGQIYNTKELRRTLAENNFKFHSHSDIEVLLKAYIHYGTNVVHHLNGVFAFAIWNTKTQELFLARDHLGVKPLFYTEYDKRIYFCF